MNRRSLIAALCLAAVANAFAGVTYDFRMHTTGTQEMTISGSVLSDGQRLRMEVDRGDGRVFRDGAIVLSRDGGKSLLVFHPPSKTYFEMQMDDMTKVAASALKSPLLEVTFDAPKASLHDHGDGGAIEGLPTRKMSMDATINIKIDGGIGQPLTSSLIMHSDNWSTDKIDPAARNLFVMSNPRTGIEALDKVMDAQAAAFIGRFPLKQVTSVRFKSSAGPEQVSTTTATVTKVRQRAIDAKVFEDPKGYRKVENPIEALTKRSRM
jgi:hypothetical protein